MIKNLIKTTLLGSYLNIIRLITSLARVKYISVTMGATGVGLVAQGTQVQLLLSTLCSFSIAAGVISRLRENKTDPSHTLKTAFTMQFICSIILVILSLIFIENMSDVLFGVTGGSFKAFMVILSVPFAVMASGYLETIFFWKERYDLYVKASSLATIIGLISTLILIYHLGLQGAFIGIFISSLALFFCFMFNVAKIYKIKDLFQFGFHKSEIRYFWKVSFVMFLSSVGIYGSQWLLRRSIIDVAGTDTNGLIQAPFALSNFYLPFIISSLWGHFHPSMSSKGFNKESLEELSIMLKFIVIVTSCSIVGLLVWPEFLIRWAFAKNFLSAVEYLPLQLFGDWFYMIVLTFGVYFLATNRLRFYAYLWSSYYLIHIIYGVHGIYSGEIKSYFYSYIAAGGFVSLALLSWLFTQLSLNKLKKLIIVLCIGVLLLLLQGFITFTTSSLFIRLIIPTAIAVAMLIVSKYLKLPLRDFLPRKGS